MTISQSGRAGINGLITSARWKEFNQTMAWVFVVFTNVAAFLRQREL